MSLFATFVPLALGNLCCADAKYCADEGCGNELYDFTPPSARLNVAVIQHRCHFATA
jgi:hypothetical protein